MIAQLVFDLPLDGPFDYLIPEHLVAQVGVGARVKVSFGPKVQIGFVVGLLEKSTIPQLKLILSLCDPLEAFNHLDLTFAKDFCAYYGCSLGEALGTMLRNKEGHRSSIHRDHNPEFVLYRCPPSSYAVKIQEIIKGHPRHARFFILVPDTFRAQMLSQQLQSLPITIATRSGVFECDGQYNCVIMVDEDDFSYKQEQMPMYETRQVLLMRSKIYGFNIAFIGLAPSVELMNFVREGQIKLMDQPNAEALSLRSIDLTNYKFVPGLLSPPLRDALEATLKLKEKSILVLNRRGSYRLTRCVDCGEILKCSHCDSPMIYSRSEGKYLCRHCTYTVAGDTVCPSCHKSNWRSLGIGVEQLQTELKKCFPHAKMVAFERATKSAQEPLPDFDILISTQAILRFQGMLRVRLAAFIDFDAQLNRLEMRSSFNAFSLSLHIGSMAESVLIQTRNSHHYCVQSLGRGNVENFYDEELKLRKEFGFAPFKHWIKISWRGKSEKSTQEMAQLAYNVLNQSDPRGYIITPPLADMVSRKRDQFCFNVMVQADNVPQAMTFIKSAFVKIKRPGRVIMTLNVDP